MKKTEEICDCELCTSPCPECGGEGVTYENGVEIKCPFCKDEDEPLED